MAFGTHQQANGKRGGQAADQLLSVHGRIWRQAVRHRKHQACMRMPITAICS
jgi:hypothetical protein